MATFSDLIFDKQGNPITIEEFDALLRLCIEYKRVGHDDVGDADVFTSWIGIDHSWGRGTPLIFESLIWGGPRNDERYWYATLEDAQAGHLKLVAELKDGTEIAV